MADAHQNLNGSCDLITPLSEKMLSAASTCYDQPISTHYEGMKRHSKYENGVVWGSSGSLTQGH